MLVRGENFLELCWFSPNADFTVRLVAIPIGANPRLAAVVGVESSIQ